MFAGLNACELLDRLNEGQGFRPGRNISKRNECTATKMEYGANGLALDPAQGLQEFQAENPGATETTVNGRKALQAKGTSGACSTAIEIGPQARVLADVVMASAHDDDKACPESQALAERVEPLLPKPPS